MKKKIDKPMTNPTQTNNKLSPECTKINHNRIYLSMKRLDIGVGNECFASLPTMINHADLFSKGVSWITPLPYLHIRQEECQS